MYAVALFMCVGRPVLFSGYLLGLECGPETLCTQLLRIVREIAAAICSWIMNDITPKTNSVYLENNFSDGRIVLFLYLIVRKEKFVLFIWAFLLTLVDMNNLVGTTRIVFVNKINNVNWVTIKSRAATAKFVYFDKKKFWVIFHN